MPEEPDRIDFDWDAANTRHLARHRIRPAEVEQVFANDPVMVDHRMENGEERWTAIGITNNARVLVIAYTLRSGRVRPITGWKADSRTRDLYFIRR